MCSAGDEVECIVLVEDMVKVSAHKEKESEVK